MSSIFGHSNSASHRRLDEDGESFLKDSTLKVRGEFLPYHHRTRRSETNTVSPTVRMAAAEARQPVADRPVISMGLRLAPRKTETMTGPEIPVRRHFKLHLEEVVSRDTDRDGKESLIQVGGEACEVALSRLQIQQHEQQQVECLVPLGEGRATLTAFLDRGLVRASGKATVWSQQADHPHPSVQQSWHLSLVFVSGDGRDVSHATGSVFEAVHER